MPRASQMPWSGSRQTLRRALGLRLDDRPQPPRQPLAAAGVQQDRVESGAEDVVLALVEGAVADAHRARAGVAGEIVARGLGQVAAPVDPVHDLQRAVLVALEVGDELHELLGLPVEVQVVQRLQREGRVAQPRVAVVPVALASRRLGQRGRQRRDGRAGRHVGQPLDRERRALDRLAPAVVGHRARVRASRASSTRSSPGGRWRRRCRSGACSSSAQESAQKTCSPWCSTWRARTQSPSTPTAMSVCSLSVSPAPVASARWPSSADRPFGRDAAVVEDRFADQLDLDLAVEADRHAHEHVLGVFVGGRPRVRRDQILAPARAERERVAYRRPAGRRRPGRQQRVGARLVDARGRHVDAERAEPERAGLAVEQRAEHARRVEARHAQPVDRAVGRHQRARVAVGEKRVLGDRRKRRGRGRALGLSWPARPWGSLARLFCALRLLLGH